jgi:hypothetical protein
MDTGMSETRFNRVFVKDNSAAAQVALYLFAILQVVVGQAIATGAVPLGIVPQACTIQRASTITNSVVNILFFGVGYLLLHSYLNRSTTQVSRRFLCKLLVNDGVAVLVSFAQVHGRHVRGAVLRSPRHFRYGTVVR